MNEQMTQSPEWVYVQGCGANRKHLYGADDRVATEQWRQVGLDQQPIKKLYQSNERKKRHASVCLISLSEANLKKGKRSLVFPYTQKEVHAGGSGDEEGGIFRWISSSGWFGVNGTKCKGKRRGETKCSSNTGGGIKKLKLFSIFLF